MVKEECAARRNSRTYTTSCFGDHCGFPSGNQKLYTTPRKVRRYHSSPQRPSWPPWRMWLQSGPRVQSDHPLPP
ncbi:hypothetical protein KM043_013962 [Ampulex compressa]|nr:hypothetical protein KM043_013962 [Ampulex compressa]